VHGLLTIGCWRTAAERPEQVIALLDRFSAMVTGLGRLSE
jgi:hypothetical protein